MQRALCLAVLALVGCEGSLKGRADQARPFEAGADLRGSTEARADADAAGRDAARDRGDRGKPDAKLSLKPSGPIKISGQQGTVIENLKITSTDGSCVAISNSQNITIRSCEIGPCGTTTGPHNGVAISGSTGVKILDSYIHPEYQASSCCDTGDGVLVQSSSDITIQGNVIAYSESNIEAAGTTTIAVVGNFLLNPRGLFPRGQNFQAWSSCKKITVEGNYALSSLDAKYLYPEHQEDSINFGESDGIVAKNNYIRGGHSASGCGLIADAAADNAQFLGNTLVDTGQCGIGIADGLNGVVDGNRVLNRTPVAGAGNTGIYVWKQYSQPCGPTTVQNNVATEVRSDGTQSGYWNGGGCDPVTASNNTWDAAAQAALEPIDTKYPPPPIPPKPFACAAASPYTNQTSAPPCATAP
jgi:hypothetical protein